MLRYEYINKEWIVSPTALRVYRVSACLSIVLFLQWCFAVVEGIPSSLASLASIVLFAGVFGAGITFVGMEYFLFRFDDSHPLKQLAWFCIMLFPMLGPALYCLVVYSRSKAVRSASAKHDTNPLIPQAPS